jgi:hypothetical protein
MVAPVLQSISSSTTREVRVHIHHPPLLLTELASIAESLYCCCPEPVWI